MVDRRVAFDTRSLYPCGGSGQDGGELGVLGAAPPGTSPAGSGAGALRGGSVPLFGGLPSSSGSYLMPRHAAKPKGLVHDLLALVRLDEVDQVRSGPRGIRLREQVQVETAAQ